MIDYTSHIPKLAAAVRKIVPHIAGDYVPGEVTESGQYRNSMRVWFAMEIPQEFGVFAPIIMTASLRTYGGKLDDGGWWLNVGLNYSHPGGGSNGCTIAAVWLDKDFEFVQARMEGGTMIKAETIVA